MGAPPAPGRSRQVEEERSLVEAGIKSRRRAATDLGLEDPEAEFGQWLEERRLAQGPDGLAPAPLAPSP